MFSKITFSRLFIFVTMVLFVTTLLLYLFFTQTKENIVTSFERTGVEEVEEISRNISQYILNSNSSMNLHQALLEDRGFKDTLEYFLATFQTQRIKNIFIVDKPNENSILFRVLLDGGKEKSDKFQFEELFEPENSSWAEVIRFHEPKVIYQDSVDALWATFLYPMVQRDGHVAILALDFSKEHYQKVVSSLVGLEVFLRTLVPFLFFIFLIMVIVIQLDNKREKEKIEVQKALEELNLTLEDRISDEVEKNRQKDQQLIHQSRLASMGEMINMIAHQWRQPLSAISSTVQGLNLKLTLKKYDETLFSEKLSDVNCYAQYLSQTIDDFRQFFKTSKEKKEVTLEEVIEKVLGIIHVTLENKKITLSMDFQSNEPLMTYSNELMQVLLNLVKNAEDSLMENRIENPWIKIATSKQDSNLILEVSDNGGGIPHEIIERIFDPYFSTKVQKDGTGLGLYMSQKIIEEHCGGSLRASNSSQGAVFTILLPR
ncbi:sensor histidine kinase [Sulfurospirillum arsenophilum]|uniref:sensor histidine kinase n=1 Tax=Sulfurospirillum arsenophilum TaxID=56698 RepID=UPI000693ACBA|nr:HAMP domain-containing sensor histidine kinase [Sulfurospirillum arsenophilum]